MFLAGDTSTNRWPFVLASFLNTVLDPGVSIRAMARIPVGQTPSPASEHIRMKTYLLALRQAMLGADPLLERFDRMVDDATAAFLETLDDNEGATAKLYLQNEAGFADEAWEHTEQGHRGPSAVGPLIEEVERADPSPADDDSNEEIVHPDAQKHINCKRNCICSPTGPACGV